MITPRHFLFTCAALSLAPVTAPAAFHLMQIEEVIAGVDGNTNAQAIELRMRNGGQNITSSSSLWVADATGANRIRLLDLTSNVPNGLAGDRVLLTSAAFNAIMVAGGSVGFTGDFTLASTIPLSYLTAGRLTFEDDAGNTSTPGTIYWSLSWGGGNYTGSNSGSSLNDDDGNYGPAFGQALPTSNKQGVLFTGTATAKGTTNFADYTITNSPTVTKNDRTSYTVVPEPSTGAFIGFGGAALAGIVFGRRRKRA